MAFQYLLMVLDMDMFILGNHYFIIIFLLFFLPINQVVEFQFTLQYLDPFKLSHFIILTLFLIQFLFLIILKLHIILLIQCLFILLLLVIISFLHIKLILLVLHILVSYFSIVAHHILLFIMFLIIMAKKNYFNYH